MTFTDEHVEAAAKAIYETHKGRVPRRWPFDSWDVFADEEPDIAEEYRDEARAALDAVKEML